MTMSILGETQISMCADGQSSGNEVADAGGFECRGKCFEAGEFQGVSVR
jgi:hypothetical protein